MGFNIPLFIRTIFLSADKMLTGGCLPWSVFQPNVSKIGSCCSSSVYYSEEERSFQQHDVERYEDEFP